MMAQHESTAAQSSAASVHPSATGLAHRAAGSPSYLPEPVTVDTHAAGEGAQQAPANVPKGGGVVDKATKGETCESDGSSRFICHICLNSPERPVVTVCGHLHWCAHFETCRREQWRAASSAPTAASGDACAAAGCHARGPVLTARVGRPLRCAAGSACTGG